ncbi:MAG TPA: hypothetical protein VHJ19_13860 [Gammaproteobacteria bacterium]|nr:hypothetical protein [Gammaproteobacteria bacterium]
MSPEIACANVKPLIELPHARILSEGEHFWSCYLRVTQRLSVRGNLVPDAHLVALLMEHGVSVLYTHNTDFRKSTVSKAGILTYPRGEANVPRKSVGNLIALIPSPFDLPSRKRSLKRMTTSFLLRLLH